MTEQEPQTITKDLAYKVLVKRGGGGRGSMSLRNAAKEIGISTATLSRIERGGVPDLATFKALCVWLGASADDLLGLTTRKSSNE